MYGYLHGQAPRYLADHLIPASEVASRLLSANRHQLIVPRCQLSTYSRQIFQLRARRSGSLYETNSDIWHVVLTVLDSFLRQSFVAFTSVTSA